MEISAEQVRLLRLHGQRLHPRRTEPFQVVKDVCGIQAQEVEAGMLSIAARNQGIKASEITHALVEERSIVRAWTMRGTLHFVTVQDYAWMLPLFGPGFIRGNRKRRADLGLDEETEKRGVRLLRDLLEARGPLTKAEIVASLSEKGIPMQGQASIHLIGLAAAQGWVCYGPPRGKKDTFVLVEDWLGVSAGLANPVGADSIEKLAHRYLSAFAPATVEDFASWAGLSLRDCRAAWEKLPLVETRTGNTNHWMLESQTEWIKESGAEEPVVRLLPRYDTYLLGYADRSLIIDPAHVKHIYPGGGVIHPAVLVDGQVTGKWKIVRKRGQFAVEAEPFGKWSQTIEKELEKETDAIKAFLEA